MSGQSLEDFLRDKKKTDEARAGKTDWPLRLQIWLGKVEQLYGEIQQYLGVALQEGTVEISWRETQLTEEYIGAYLMNSMVIRVGGERVSLKPRGTLIVGAFGRIDMEGYDDSLMLVLKGSDSTPGVKINELTRSGSETENVSIGITIGTGGENPDITQAVWHIASRSPHLQSWPLSKETFAEALKRVMRK